MIEDMGREIVRLESPSRPGERIRLWFSKDILHVFKENKNEFSYAPQYTLKPLNMLWKFGRPYSMLRGIKRIHPRMGLSLPQPENLAQGVGFEKTEIIMLHLLKDKGVQWDGNALKNMENLKIL
ncbi:resistance protein, partial [Trifolium medium]|nr:resistance protein [Trifolium medium]